MRKVYKFLKSENQNSDQNHDTTINTNNINLALNSDTKIYGELTWPDGAKYIGFINYNKANGHGKFYHLDGDIFTGN